MPSAAVRPTCKPFGASWPTADRSASLSLKPLKNCLAPRFKLQSAASCTPLPSCLSAGLSNAHLPGSKNVAVYGKTANGNSIPACSSSTWPSSYYCSKDREQVLRRSSYEYMDYLQVLQDFVRIPRWVLLNAHRQLRKLRGAQHAGSGPESRSTISLDWAIKCRIVLQLFSG